MKYLYMILRLFFRPKCGHKWQEHGSAMTKSDITNKYTGKIFILKCVKCGDMKNVRVAG